MDNFDFVEHLLQTDSNKNTSQEIVESFVRAYYQETHAALVKWAFTLDFDYEDQEHFEQSDQAFAELNAIHQKFWLPDSRFTEYWKPAFGSASKYEIADPGITILSDMLGNFIANVTTSDRKQHFYLLSVIRDRLSIVNSFF